MGGNQAQTDVKEITSLSHELADYIRNKRHNNILPHLIHQAQSVRSSVNSDFNDTLIAISDYQKKIDDCKRKIEATKFEVGADEEIEGLQKELDEELKGEQLLREELRVIADKISELDHQRLSIEEERQKLKKLQEEHYKVERKLSFYASVTNIIPNLESKSKISGDIVEHHRKTVEKFEFDLSKEDEFDVCNDAWKMIT